MSDDFNYDDPNLDEGNNDFIDPFVEESEYEDDDDNGVSLDYLKSKGGILAGILLFIAALFGYFKFAKNTNKIQKEQVLNSKIYKKQNIEAVEKIKEIDRETKEIIKDLIKQEEKSEEIKNDISNIVNDTVAKIEETKKMPGGRTITNTNDRLRKSLTNNRK